MWIGIGAILAVAVPAAVVVWLVVIRDDSKASSAEAAQVTAIPPVGTYPVDNAYGVLNELAKAGGESSFTAPKGGFAVYSTEHPTNLYLAYPGSDVQIEVYDPSAEHARELITSGQVVPVP